MPDPKALANSIRVDKSTEAALAKAIRALPKPKRNNPIFLREFRDNFLKKLGARFNPGLPIYQGPAMIKHQKRRAQIAARLNGGEEARKKAAEEVPPPPPAKVNPTTGRARRDPRDNTPVEPEPVPRVIVPTIPEAIAPDADEEVVTNEEVEEAIAALDAQPEPEPEPEPESEPKTELKLVPKKPVRNHMAKNKLKLPSNESASWDGDTGKTPSEIALEPIVPGPPPVSRDQILEDDGTVDLPFDED